MKRYFKAHIIGIALIIIFSLIYTIHLGRDYLTDWDECVIVQQAKEMKQNGNYLTNFWNGEPLLEKPPLNAILTQIPFLFGVNEFNARILMVIYGGILAILLYYFSSKYISKVAGIVSILLFFGNNLFSVYMRHVNTDIGFTLFSFGAFLLWYEYLIHRKKSKKNVILSGILCGLAVLMKGLSILPYLVGFFTIGLLLNGKKSIVPFFYLVFSFLLWILPWHVYQYVTYGNEFLYVYFYEHLWKRSRYPVDFHFEGRLFYIKTILRYFHVTLVPIMIPFIIPLASLLKGLLRRPWLSLSISRNDMKLRSDKIRKFITKNQFLIVLTIMIFIPLLMITNVRTRILWYVMPIFPYIILLVSYSIISIQNLLKNKFINHIIILVILICLGTGVISQIEQNVKPLSKREAYLEEKRYDVFFYVKKMKITSIKYLVWEPERVAEAILPRESKLSTTFRFGGNPCAVYYSDKKIFYQYSLERFYQNLNKGEYFIMYKDDFEKLNMINKKRLYYNGDFGVFKVL